MIEPPDLRPVQAKRNGPRSQYESIYTDTGAIIAENIPFGLGERIALAVNCHDDLVSACVAVLDSLCSVQALVPETLERIIAQMDKAIAKVKGESAPTTERS